MNSRSGTLAGHHEISHPERALPPGVLVLDEDTATAERVREVLRTELADPVPPVHWCDTLYEAFDTLANHPVGLLVSDLYLDGEQIVGGLRRIKECYPALPTLVMGTARETGSRVDLFGLGCAFLPKPSSREQLARSLKAGLSRTAEPAAARPAGAVRFYLPAWWR